MRQQKQSMFRSFVSSFRGFRYALAERSFLIECAIGAVVLALAFLVFDLTRFERIVIVLLVGFVLALEIFNTAIESLLDHLSPNEHASVARIKELLAAGVLIIALCAAAVAALIFLQAGSGGAPFPYYV